MRKSLLLLAALSIATAIPGASSAFDGRGHWRHEGWHYHHHHWYPAYYYPPYAYAPPVYVAPAPTVGIYGRF